jgi:hypothetical protein
MRKMCRLIIVASAFDERNLPCACHLIVKFNRGRLKAGTLEGVG